MFPPLGLFQDIPCPQGQHCALLVCLFSHKEVTPGKKSSEPAREDVASAPKKRKLESVVEDKPQRRAPAVPQHEAQNPARTPVKPAARAPTELQSAARKVSPPPRAVSAPGKDQKSSTTAHPAPKGADGLPPRKARKESLNPRMLTKAPASHGVRLSILTKLHSAMSALNAKMAGDQKSPNKYLVLSPTELVTMALDEEEKAAKDNPNVYSNIIKLRIVKLSKMSMEDWANEVKAHLNARYYKFEPIQEAPSKPKPFVTGLSAQEEIAIISKLITPLEGLEEYGYVTRAPTKEEIDGARKGVEGSKGWEQCCRCGGRFQVWPGRREDGSLTSGGQCTYHPGKPMYPPRTQTEHITGPKEAYFPCCNEGIGTSSGCTKGETHTFKVSETKRLASVLQFEKTPWQKSSAQTLRPPVSFDCEMGYTTLGMELIRLTAVSWPDGNTLLDILVRPMGEVLDLNSRFSGVFLEHYANAVPYSGNLPGNNKETNNPESGNKLPLQVVDSPAAARALLFEHLQPDTPLIGHAIDNDLNACRIIHPTVVDTVLLYPAPRGGLPYRMGLKTLSRRYLERDIQMGGERGHDSKEDAVATGDLVRVKVVDTWKGLKGKGCGIKEGKLVSPSSS